MNPRAAFQAACTGLAIALTACTSPGGNASSAGGEPAGMVIAVGSFDFSESVLLAEIYGQALAADRFPVRIMPNLGPREVVDPALMDAMGTLVTEGLKSGEPGSRAGRQRARGHCRHRGPLWPAFDR